jgi:hypothetical protein
MRGSATTSVEPFTLEDGYVTFHDDGSTELHITIPPGKRTPANGGFDELEIQYSRLVTRLLELALGWQREKAV